MQLFHLCLNHLLFMSHCSSLQAVPWVALGHGH
uniref:Truncated precore/core protein n=1 Tax=Hepatitis B virus TaxID=10407 RepID=A0A1B1ACJ8_HBV|nr:truncated precore/core protein [Hepatitis B virus]